MESMIAVMAVIISLTAFLSFLSFSVSHVPEKGTDVPTDMLDGVRIVNGGLEADIEEEMNGMLERYGYTGMRVILSLAGSDGQSLTVNVGSNDSDNIISKGGTVVIRSDEGRSVPVNYMVAVWS